MFEAFDGAVVQEDLATPVVDDVSSVRDVGACGTIEGFAFGWMQRSSLLRFSLAAWSYE